MKEISQVMKGSLTEIRCITAFMENNIDGFIIGIEGYSETFNHLVKMSELNDICKMLKEYYV